MAQSVERRLGKAEVTGPIPVSSLKEERESLSFLLWIPDEKYDKITMYVV